MNRKRLRSRLLFFSQYIPFTVNTILYAIVFCIAYKLLYRPVNPKAEEQEVSSFLPIILLMARMAFWFLLALIGTSVLTTFFAWIYYRVLVRRDKDLLQIQFEQDPKKNRLQLHTSVAGVLRPLLGFVKGRLVYEDDQLTDSFALLSRNQRKKSGIRGVAGMTNLLLPDVREYSLRGSFLYFQDMLRLVSIASYHPLPGHFQVPPLAYRKEYDGAHPRKTESNEIRSEQLHRTEGDYLNYKDFESGDDVRRIVWKVYARSRELVVRVPELYEPFVSHVYCYASFYTASKQALGGNEYTREMTNYFKNQVWTVYRALAAKEYEVRFVPDQELNVSEEGQAASKVSRIITASQWQQQRPLSQYFNARQGAVLCISSFTEPDDLRETLDQCGSNTVVYFVKCSSVFRHVVAWNWLKRLVLLPPSDRLGKLRSGWVFAPFRFKMQKREEELEAILRASSVTHATL